MSDHTLTLASGRTLGFSEYGDPAGTPCFFFHGWPSSRLQGEIMDGPGKKLGLRVISPDRPGIATSDFQPGRGLLDWPPLLEEMAGQLGFEKFHLMGVSGGGPYVLAAAHALPDRILRAGVCCGAVPLAILGTKELLWVYRLALWSKRWVPFALGPGLRFSAWMVGLPPANWPIRQFIASLCPADQKTLRDDQVRRILAASATECLRGPVAGVRHDGEIYSTNWGFKLEDIRIPLWFWHGGLDRNIPLSYAQRTVQMIPQTQTHWFPEDGHYSLAFSRMGEIAEEMLR